MLLLLYGKKINVENYFVTRLPRPKRFDKRLTRTPVPGRTRFRINRKLVRRQLLSYVTSKRVDGFYTPCPSFSLRSHFAWPQLDYETAGHPQRFSPGNVSIVKSLNSLKVATVGRIREPTKASQTRVLKQRSLDIIIYTEPTAIRSRKLRVYNFRRTRRPNDIYRTGFNSASIYRLNLTWIGET